MGAVGSKEAAAPPGCILTQAEESPASPQLNSRLLEGQARVVLSTVERGGPHGSRPGSHVAGQLAGNHG